MQHGKGKPRGGPDSRLEEALISDRVATLGSGDELLLPSILHRRHYARSSSLKRHMGFELCDPTSNVIASASTHSCSMPVQLHPSYGRSDSQGVKRMCPTATLISVMAGECHQSAEVGGIGQPKVGNASVEGHS